MPKLSRAEAEAITARQERDQAREKLAAMRGCLEEVWAVLSEATCCEEVMLARQRITEQLGDDNLLCLVSLPGERGAELRARLRNMRGW